MCSEVEVQYIHVYTSSVRGGVGLQDKRVSLWCDMIGYEVLGVWQSPQTLSHLSNELISGLTSTKLNRYTIQ